VNYSTTGRTNGNVILTVVASDDGVGLHAQAYSYNNGTWTASNIYEVDQNGTVNIRVRDKNENIATKTENVTNIDKDLPTGSASVALNGAKTEATVTITASDALSGLHAQAYRHNGGARTSDNTFRTTANGNGSTEVRDVAGNIATINWTVSGIEAPDTTPPTINSVNYSTTSWTNGNVILTVIASDDGVGLHAQAYSYNNGTWTASNTYEADQNGTVNIRVRDKNENIATKTETVTNIDKDLPTGSASVTLNGAKTEATVTITASDALSGLHAQAYRHNGGSRTSDNTFKTTANGNGSTEVRDVAGNIATINWTVSGIDTEAPTVTNITYSTTAPTNQNVTVTLTFSEAVKPIAGWQKLSDTQQSKIYTENISETVHFEDLAGNAGSAQIIISNIDKIAPVITVLGNNPHTMIQGETYTDAGATATDNRDGDITHRIQTSGKVDTAIPGIYTITYTVSDEAGNVATATRTVEVKKDTAIDYITLPEAVLYPNPAVDQFTVVMAKPIIAIRIVNMQGSEIMNIKGNGSNEQLIHISQLPTGQYLVQIFFQEGYSVAKFIKE